MKHALVTGVSSGIGKATALKFLEQGFYVFGSVRNSNDAKDLENQYPKAFHKLIFDITDYSSVDSALGEVYEKLGKNGLDVLVNNAGVAKYGPMQHVEIDELRNQFEINVFATVNITQKLLPKLGAYKGATHKGKLFVISSAAGIMTRPMLGPYSSSKHAIEAIFDAYRRELMMYGIDVVIIEPGPIKTDIWNKAKDDKNPYEHTEYKDIFAHLNKAVREIENIALPAERVADKIWKAYISKNPKVRYLITPKKFAFYLAMHILPAKILDKIFYRELKKLSKL